MRGSYHRSAAALCGFDALVEDLFDTVVVRPARNSLHGMRRQMCLLYPCGFRQRVHQQLLHRLQPFPACTAPLRRLRSQLGDVAIYLEQAFGEPPVGGLKRCRLLCSIGAPLCEARDRSTDTGDPRLEMFHFCCIDNLRTKPLEAFQLRLRTGQLRCSGKGAGTRQACRRKSLPPKAVCCTTAEGCPPPASPPTTGVLA